MVPDLLLGPEPLSDMDADGEVPGSWKEDLAVLPVAGSWTGDLPFLRVANGTLPLKRLDLAHKNSVAMGDPPPLQRHSIPIPHHQRQPTRGTSHAGGV